MSLPLWHPKGCAWPGQSQQPQPGTGDVTWHVGSQHSPPGRLQGLRQPRDRWEAGASPSSPRGCWHCWAPSTGTSAPDHSRAARLGSRQDLAQAQEQGTRGAGGQVALDPKEGLGKWRQQGEADGSGLWLISVPWRGEEPAGGIDTSPPPQAQGRQDKVGTPQHPQGGLCLEAAAGHPEKGKGNPRGPACSGHSPIPKGCLLLPPSSSSSQC